MITHQASDARWLQSMYCMVKYAVCYYHTLKFSIDIKTTIKFDKLFEHLRRFDCFPIHNYWLIKCEFGIKTRLMLTLTPFRCPLCANRKKKYFWRV